MYIFFRKFLSSWAYQVRPVGRPHFRWADSIGADLKRAGLPTTRWAEKAADKAAWKEMLRYIDEPKQGRKKKKRALSGPSRPA